MSTGPATPMLEMTGITKRFGEVVANEGVDLAVLPGQVHTLLGENGAGKSTLMKILYGLYRPDEGQIKIDGTPVDITSPSDAIDRGIGMIHQHFMLVPTLTVAENVALGLRSPLSGADMAPIKRKLAEVSERYRLNVDPDAYIWQLAVGERQRAEILKALYRDARLLVLDEPTAVLTPPEVDDLFATLRQMTADERGLIFISHKLHEVMDLSDEITVLRDGRVTGVTRPSEATRESLAELMVGRPVDLTRTLPHVDQGEAKLAVSNLTVRGDRGLVAVDGVSFEVRAGEIVGIAGVSGNGQRELAEAIVGLRPIDSGELVVDGDLVTNPTPKGVRARGVSYVPEERMVHGAIADFTVAENLMLLDYAEEPYAKRGSAQPRSDRRPVPRPRVSVLGEDAEHRRPYPQPVWWEHPEGGHRPRAQLRLGCSRGCPANPRGRHRRRRVHPRAAPLATLLRGCDPAHLRRPRRGPRHVGPGDRAVRRPGDGCDRSRPRHQGVDRPAHVGRRFTDHNWADDNWAEHGCAEHRWRLMTRLALYLQDAHSMADAIEHTRYAESRGFEAVWQADSRLVREAGVAMAAFGATTDTIKIGSGVIDVWTRNPARLASLFATLDDLAPGRIICGLGAWWDPLASKVGVDRARPLKVMREVVDAVRALLANETVTMDGYFVHLDGVELDYVHQERRPKDVPIYIGATGPQMMQLTGEIADGVVLNYLVSPDYNRTAMEQLAAGAAKAGRTVDDIDRPQLIVCSVDADRKAALDGARLLVTQYLGQQPHIMKASGVPQSLLDDVGKVLTWPATHDQVVEASKLVPDEIVQMICAAGTPDDCRAKVDEYIAAGCTCPILYPLGPDVRLMIDTFADN